MNRSGLRAPKLGPKRLVTSCVVVVVIAAAIGAMTNGFGVPGARGEAVQSVNSAVAPFTISSTNVAGDPGGTAITETVNDMYQADFRERLVTITPGAASTPAIGLSVSGIKTSDTSPAWASIDNEQPDALDILQGSNDTTTAGQPGGNAPLGQGGLFVEAYTCSGTWSSAAGAVAAATDDRDYTCSAGANGTLLATYDVPAAGSSPTQWIVPPSASATTILLRTRFTDDGSSGYRQAVQTNEQVTLTHRFDSSGGVQTTGAAEPSNHNCVVRTDATIWCWGKNGNGELGVGTTNDSTTPLQVGTATDWASVANGDFHTCAIKTTNTVWCWGDNTYGQLGDGTTTQRTTPVQIGALTTWSQVSAGGGHTCSVKTDGTTWCWGRNGNGQLGDNTTTQRTSPVQAAVATDWANVQTGAFHTCARKTTRALWCWGDNTYGQLGDNTTTQRLVPTNTNGANLTWDIFDLGARHTCATRTGGTLWCWGYNQNGQLAKGDTTQRSAPSQVGALTTWNSVDLGSYHTCATKTDGTLWCAGANGQGELGQNTQINRSAPTRIGAVATWSSISSQNANTCAIRSDGTLWCWGDNSQAQVGDATYTGRNSPIQVGVATDWTQVAVGTTSTCARKTNNTLWCWGYNGFGELGDGTTTARTTPNQVGALTTWASVAAGVYFMCATQTNGTLWCWGLNGSGQLGQGTTNFTPNPTPLQIGAATDWATVSASSFGSHTCATKTTGTLWCWGANWAGQLGLGDTTPRSTPTQIGALTTWATVTTGYAHSCATQTTGTLWCWGYNGLGQLGDGTYTDRLTPVQIGVATTWSQSSLSTFHTCARRTDTSLWCWGLNWTGQLGLGDVTIRNVPIQVNGIGWNAASTGGFFSCAINAGWLYCWGNNSYNTSIANEYGTLGNAPTPDLTSFTQVGTATDWAAAFAGTAGASCGRKITTNYVWCWGSGAYGSLGVGDQLSRALPNVAGSANNGRSAGAA